MKVRECGMYGESIAQSILKDAWYINQVLRFELLGSAKERADFRIRHQPFFK